MIVLYQVYFRHCAFDGKLFSCSCEGVGKSLNYFKFGTFIGRFPSEHGSEKINLDAGKAVN